MSLRIAGNMGSFYPKEPKELERYINTFNQWEAKLNKTLPNIRPKAIISPHAGYIYSGFSANLAHKLLAQRKVKRIVVIGPSHHLYFEGVSGSFFDEYQTPLGNLTIERKFLEKLDEKFGLEFIKEAHQKEHSTETQMPFIAHYQPHVKVVELIYGKTSYEALSKIISCLLKDEETSVVISTDLSHFYNLKEANALDAICLEGVKKLDNTTLNQGCEACGLLGIKALIKSSNELGLKSQILDYRTSADASGDTQRVVGYMSGVVY